MVSAYGNESSMSSSLTLPLLASAAAALAFEFLSAVAELEDSADMV